MWKAYSSFLKDVLPLIVAADTHLNFSKILKMCDLNGFEFRFRLNFLEVSFKEGQMFKMYSCYMNANI